MGSLAREVESCWFRDLEAVVRQQQNLCVGENIPIKYPTRLLSLDALVRRYLARKNFVLPRLL